MKVFVCVLCRDPLDILRIDLESVGLFGLKDVPKVRFIFQDPGDVRRRGIRGCGDLPGELAGPVLPLNVAASLPLSVSRIGVSGALAGWCAERIFT